MSTEPEAGQEEKIEGQDDERERGWGNYPIDTLHIRNESRTVYEIVRRIEKKQYVMDPDFQRDFIWDKAKQSKLIESVLMRIPLPVFYLAEDPQGRMIVVDGLQRLSTFDRFVHDKLRLNLPDQGDLHGKLFSDLSPKLQNRVEDTNLILYIVDANVPERARLDIFERVNGGVPLTRQQMRNCLYNGAATHFLRDEASEPLFLKATGRSLRPGTMRDREFVNRFCAFQILGPDAYGAQGKKMDEFLAECLTKMNLLSPIDLETLSSEFRAALHNNFFLFGRNTFRKHVPGQERRAVLNASLWDVMSTGLSRRKPDEVKAQQGALKKGFYDLLAKQEFIDSITYGPNTPAVVRTRFRLMRTMLAEAFND